MTAAGGEHSTVTLRALLGEPLRDEAVRSTVLSTARAIAERTGVGVVHIETQPDRVTVTLAAPRVASLGFAGELRRLTERWYRARFGSGPTDPTLTLWGDPPKPHDGADPPDPADPADWWKHT
jgi:hypothetical protein